jgi:hypothetical protein
MAGTALTEITCPSFAGHERHRCIPARRRGIARGDDCRRKITTLLDHRFHGVQCRPERVHHGLVPTLSLATLHDAGEPSAQCRIQGFAIELDSRTGRTGEAKKESSVQRATSATDGCDERHGHGLEQLVDVGRLFFGDLVDHSCHASSHVRAMIGITDSRVQLGQLGLVLDHQLVKTVQPADQLVEGDHDV